MRRLRTLVREETVPLSVRKFPFPELTPRCFTFNTRHMAYIESNRELGALVAPSEKGLRLVDRPTISHE
jgi:hypothetical protein